MQTLNPQINIILPPTQEIIEITKSLLTDAEYCSRTKIYPLQIIDSDDDSFNSDSYQITDEICDVIMSEKTFNSLKPRDKWKLINFGDYSPAIGYLSGGHINLHYDPTWYFTADAHICTYLHCLESTDSNNGGTNFYFGNNEVFHAKESVTKNSGIIFPGYLLHSGRPVEYKKMKFIVQFLCIECREPTKELVKIQLLDGYYIVRKNEIELLNIIDKNMTMKEFYPTYIALRGHPTYGKAYVENKYYIPEGSDEIYDILENGWYATLDEAMFHANMDITQLRCTIHFGMEKYENFSYNEYFNYVITKIKNGKNYDNVTNPQISYPFKKYGNLKLNNYTSNYIHVAWKKIE